LTQNAKFRVEVPETWTRIFCVLCGVTTRSTRQLALISGCRSGPLGTPSDLGAHRPQAALRRRLRLLYYCSKLVQTPSPRPLACRHVTSQVTGTLSPRPGPGFDSEFPTCLAVARPWPGLAPGSPRAAGTVPVTSVTGLIVLSGSAVTSLADSDDSQAGPAVAPRPGARVPGPPREPGWQLSQRATQGAGCHCQWCQPQQRACPLRRPPAPGPGRARGPY
jgi:hypothetical protein